MTKADATQLPHELVASLVLVAHAALPPSFQPAPTPTGPTWTPLAGVVLLPPPASSSVAGTPPTLNATVISLGTGSKVLPEARKSVCGDLVVDMHAETLAIRGARRWLADELVRCAGAADSPYCWLEPPTEGEPSSPVRWRLKAGVEVWLYASDIPCGEASTAYLARQQLLHDPAMAALQISASTAAPSPDLVEIAAAAAAGPLRGRAGYPRARTLRTKPGRPDAPVAYSLSCSDKIARYGALGIQGALLADLLEPVWLSGVVLGPVDAAEDRKALKAEVAEALSGRVVRELEDEGIKASLPKAFATPHPVEVHVSASLFTHSRLALPITPAPVPSPFCTLWFAGILKPEKLAAGGFRLGAAKRKGGATLAPSGRSAVCKLAWAARLASVRVALGHDTPPAEVTYHALKASPLSTNTGYLSSADEAVEPDKKRPRLGPSDDSPHPLAGAHEGTAAYQIAKQAFRRPGALFDGWHAADARWEAFTVPAAANSQRP